ncbi:MAG: hypothetical protein M3O62_07000 [Pseudomonadota bacterium]|nr:hypothetical protein [Pseudomonadota bacterium]
MEWTRSWRIPALTLGIAALLLRAAFVSSDLDPQGVEVLRVTVSHEYRSYQFARTDLDRESRETLVENAGQVSFRKLSARYDGERVVVRAKIEPNPAMPPGDPPVRYFNLEHNLVTGWVYASRSTALSYYTAIIPLM